MKTIYIVITAIILVGGFLWYKQATAINSFQDCVDAGNPVMESFPRRCQAGDRLFVEDKVEVPNNDSTTDDGVMCTMEVKECPDGSYVGRTPPNCEFETCPGE